MIGVRYKCTCMGVEAEVEIPSRYRDTGIEDWMNLVQHCLTIHHTAHSPLCQLVTTEYIKIPYDEKEPGVGMKAVVN